MAVDPALSWAFVAAGAAMQGIALLLARQPLRLLRAGGRARGMVTGNEEAIVSSGRGSPRRYFLPVVSFATNRGERIVFTSASGGRQPLATDSSVDVLYDPAEPHRAMLVTFRNLWMFPLITATFGLPFLLFGISGLL